MLAQPSPVPHRVLDTVLDPGGGSVAARRRAAPWGCGVSLSGSADGVPRVCGLHGLPGQLHGTSAFDGGTAAARPALERAPAHGGPRSGEERRRPAVLALLV